MIEYESGNALAWVHRVALSTIGSWHPWILRPRVYRTDLTRRSKFLTHALIFQSHRQHKVWQIINSWHRYHQKYVIYEIIFFTIFIFIFLLNLK